MHSWASPCRAKRAPSPCGAPRATGPPQRPSRLSGAAEPEAAAGHAGEGSLHAQWRAAGARRHPGRHLVGRTQLFLRRIRQLPPGGELHDAPRREAAGAGQVDHVRTPAARAANAQRGHARHLLVWGASARRPVRWVAPGQAVDASGATILMQDKPVQGVSAGQRSAWRRRGPRGSVHQGSGQRESLPREIPDWEKRCAQ
mmetsp:Transcript_70586/g.161790  ORF Transcript_70586/g.161790 Transcript_70586/m.161790 type:complete len:200 (-) Transcript_70586:4428-5027(-)